MNNSVELSPGRLWTVVDLETDSTEVYGGPAQLVGVHIHTGISAQNCPIKDDTSDAFQIPASAATGEWYEAANMRYTTNITVDPDNSATGKITVVYIPDHEGLVGSGAGLP